MPDIPLSANELQSRMRDLRRELRTDVTFTTAAAKRLTDWRYYVRQFPWASAALAATVGFLLVPRKRQRPLIDEAALAKMAAQKRVVVVPQKEQTTTKTMMRSMGGLLAAAATRAAMSYVSDRFAQMNGSAAEATSQRVRTPK